jgi:hypothetical protein
MIDTEYIVDYFKVGKPTGQVLKLFLTILDECTKQKYLAGYPYWKAGQAIKKLGLPKTPGMQAGATWCPFVAGYVIHKMGYEIRPFTDKKYEGTKAIGYTSGNEMADEAALAAEAGVIKEIGKNQVNKYANQGIPVLIAATGVTANGKRGTGHVAIAAPSRNDFINVGQAGIRNGFFPLGDAFPARYVNPPRFYVPNKRSK